MFLVASGVSSALTSFPGQNGPGMTLESTKILSHLNTMDACTYRACQMAVKLTDHSFTGRPAVDTENKAAVPPLSDNVAVEHHREHGSVTETHN